MSVALTRSRFINALRCYWNYALSRIGLVRISHGPMFVSVEPASVCQLRCPECPVGQGRPTPNPSLKGREFSGAPYMSREVWERVLEEIKKTAHTVQFYFQGEPLLHKELNRMIYEANKYGLYTIVSTNAQAMTQDLAMDLIGAGLDRIIISMDGLTEESYQAYRVGGSLEQCKKAIGYLRKAKDYLETHTVIEIQCLRLRTNEHEWAEFKCQYKALGADRLVFKTAQLYNYADGHPLMPDDPRYSRYIQGEDGKYHRRKLGKGCLRVWSGVVITTDGEVLPCCYDKARAHTYGNIMEKPLRELFGSEKAKAFRRAALTETPEICKECYR